MFIRTSKQKHKTKNWILSPVFTLKAEKQQTYQVNERVVLQRHWTYWTQHISRLDVANVFAVFTEKGGTEGQSWCNFAKFRSLEVFVKKCRWWHSLKRVAKNHFDSKQNWNGKLKMLRSLNEITSGLCLTEQNWTEQNKTKDSEKFPNQEYYDQN